MNQSLKLSQPAAGFEGVVARIGGDKALQRKLISLGIRRGQTISILHQRKNGVVILSNGSRIALGSTIAANIFLDPVTDAHDQTRAAVSAA